jgi:hypothetical protein
MDPLAFQAESPEHIQIDVDLDVRACYALSVNRRPPVRSVTVRNLDGVFSGTLTISLTSEWTAAQRPPIREVVQAIDCPVIGGATEVDFTTSRLDDIALAYLDDTASADVIVTVRDAEGHQQSKRFEILVLARNQWRADLMEITGAFVQSRHPAIPEILSSASTLLIERTGRGDLEGYQSGPDRVMHIANAIYDALGQRITTYLDTPPGEFEFDIEGQRVRTLDMLLETGQGNCIELACAFAACVYAAGISPVIFLVHNHAFGGFYLESRHAGKGWNKILTREIASITNVLEQGSVVALETTAIPSRMPFAEAVRAIRPQLADRKPGCPRCERAIAQGMPPNHQPHLEAVLDVSRSRAEGILELPVRTIQDGQEVLIIDQGGNQPPLVERRDPVTRRLLPSSVPIRIQKWKSALLDLSRKSRLISFNAASQGLELVCMPDQLGELEDFLVDGGTVRIFTEADINDVLKAAGITHWAKAPEEVLRQLWQSARAIPAAVDPKRRYVKEERIDVQGQPVVERVLVEEALTVAERARDLLRKSREAEADSGVNNLHLGLGRVTWPFQGVEDLGADIVQSPVFLVPIRIQVPRGDKPPSIALAEDAMTTPNFSLIEALRKKFGLRLAWFDEDMSDDSGLDIQRGLDELRRELMSTGLADRGLRVEATAAIGVFPFQKVRLWKDLNDHWEDFLENPVVKHLVEVGTGSFLDPADPDDLGVPTFFDTTLLNPQPADGAQTRAIVRALAGQSFVLEGPPGTGKSQTITNLLANALSRGMKVLFVAEKPDARSVVLERLQEVGLDPFCLDLHDQGSGPQQIKDQLRDALDFQPTDVEAKWQGLEERYQTVVDILARYRDRVHGAAPGGRSYFDAFETLLEMGSGAMAPIGRALFQVGVDDVTAIRKMLLELPSFTEAAQVNIGHPWAFAGPVQVDSLDRQFLADTIANIGSSAPALLGAPEPWSSAFSAASDLGDVLAAVACARVIDQGQLPSASEWRAISRSDWRESTQRALTMLGAAITVSQELGLEVSVLGRDLAAQAAAVSSAASSFVMGRKGRVAAALGDLSPTFASVPVSELSAAFGRLATASQEYREAIDRLKVTEGMALRLLSDPVDERGLQVLSTRAADLQVVAEAVQSPEPFGTACTNCLTQDVVLPRLAEAEQCISGLTTLLTMCGATQESQALWIGGRPPVSAIGQSLPTWQSGVDGLAFMALRRWSDLVAHVAMLDTPLFADFRVALLNGSIPADDAVDAFDRAQLSAVLTVVGEEQTLDVFDQAKQDRAVRRFIDLTEERQVILKDLIPARLYARRRFDAGSSVGSVANLRTELASKRRGARSVRHLIAKYPELISELTPCFLMGPDSVAKFIPPGSINFDLIVFDEASQILVEEAIGAMGRGQAVVIVGDSRQMPPSAAFTAKAGEGESDESSFEDLEAPVEEAESILEEVVEAGLPREMLAWHYRSRDEVLISFSNEKYYDRKLGTFPSPFPQRPGVGITYHRVNGQFLHGSKDSSGKLDAEREARAGGAIQTNPIEADTIVAEVRRHLHDPELSQFTLGVITLNKKQAELVEKKLRDSKDPKIIDQLDHEDPTQRLLVLNLERVQGRERDIIILGTSFSNRAGTDKMPLQFGPLTAKGGERRLNVAITRARRQVIVFSSFDPQQLQAAKPLGMQHLFEYLVMAERASMDRDALDHDFAAKDDLYVREVAEALRAQGLSVRVGYGLSNFKVDIAVGHPSIPDRWLVGVLLDGRVWSQRSLVLDRDGLPVMVLTRMMDWPAIARVWLPAWRRDRQEIIDEIVQLVDLVRSGQPISSPDDSEQDAVDDIVASGAPAPAHALPTDPNPPADRPSPEPPSSEGIEVRPFQPLELQGSAGSPDDIEHSGAIISELLLSVSDRYGPIESTVALKAIARVFGLDRLRQARLTVMEGFLPEGRIVRTRFGNFLFPAESLDGQGKVSDRFNWYRVSTFAERSLDQIPPHEVANAAVKIATDAFTIDINELAVSLLNTFGYARKTADATRQMLERLEWVIEQGRLLRDGDMIRAV